MIRRWLIGILTMLWTGLCLSISAAAPVEIQAIFPYSLTEGASAKVTAGSTQLFYFSLEHANRPDGGGVSRAS